MNNHSLLFSDLKYMFNIWEYLVTSHAVTSKNGFILNKDQSKVKSN
jgi:hypothetical protein